jgi:hypothetical protein
MSPSLVEEAKPWRQSCAGFVVAGEGLPVGPIGLKGSDGAFAVAVLPGAMRPDGELLGNFPHAFGHIGLVSAARAIGRGTAAPSDR